MRPSDPVVGFASAGMRCGAFSRSQVPQSSVQSTFTRGEAAVAVKTGSPYAYRFAVARLLGATLRIMAALPAHSDFVKQADDRAVLALVDEHVRDRYALTAVVEGRPRRAQAWRDLGLAVVEVSDGEV